MSTLSGIFASAQSGLQVAQAGINTVSNNVANVNTTGYVREVVNQSSTATAGAGTGVKLDSITRATNTYLESANLAALSDSGSASVISSLLDQAQSLFGDPSGTDSADGSASSTETNSFFDQLDNVFTAFSTVAANPTAASESSAVTTASTFLSSAQSVTSGLQQLGGQADEQINSDVTTANELLSQISSLNSQISQANITGSDATGSENQQSSLVQQLSGLMNVTTSTGANGVVTVRAADGTVLADGRGAASLSYDSSGPTGQISITPYQGTPQSGANAITSGELSGLIDLRNVQLPGIAAQVSQLVGQTVSQLNAVSNSYSSYPAPSTLTGSNTGMSLTTDLNNFTGTTNIAFVNSSGVVQAQAQVTFNGSAGTVTVNGSTVPTSQFLNAVNSALGSTNAVSFNNGVLSVSAGASGNGVVVSDDTSAPTQKGSTGQSFSTFFGLNNLIQSNTVTNTDTGLTTLDQSGFPQGQTITFRLSAADGSTLKDVTITTPAGGTMQDLLTTLNNKTSGVGAYGSFTLSSTGQLNFTASGNSGVGLSVYADGTQNSVGTSMSQLFDLGSAQQTAVVNSYSVRSDILNNPAYLQTSAVDLSAASSGQAIISPGDASGMDALSQAGQTAVSFDAAGGLGATKTSLTNYASELSGSLATNSAAAATASTDASAVSTEATSRLSGAEGVNIDTELVALTTYQQSYNASARLIQAASDMFNTLLTMVGNG